MINRKPSKQPFVETPEKILFLWDPRYVDYLAKYSQGFSG